MRKIPPILFLLLLLAPAAEAFNDLKSVPLYAESIRILEQRGALRSGERFFPEQGLSRIAFVHMMHLSGAFPEECPHPPLRFSDTQLNQWYTPALRSGVLCGGIRGDEKQAFRPGDPIRYAEAAALLQRSARPSLQSAEEPWYRPGIAFLESSKIALKENPAPEAFLTRAQGAFLLERVLAQQKPAFSGKKLVESARTQKGVVTSYDTGYYSGGFPPPNTGACTDVIERALRDLGYDWKGQIDRHMRKNPSLYPSKYDENINYRRVRNVKVFLDHTASSLPLESDYLSGDIITYDQIPGSLWHIAIVSDKKASDGTPLLIHNYGRGVKEDNLLHLWPAPKTGHYRLRL